MQVGQEAGMGASYYNGLIAQMNIPSAAIGREAGAINARQTTFDARKITDASDAVPLVGPAAPEVLQPLKPIRPPRFTDFLAPKPQLSPLDEILLMEQNQDNGDDILAARRSRLRSGSQGSFASQFYELNSRNNGYGVDVSGDATLIEAVELDELAQEVFDPLEEPFADTVAFRAAAAYAGNVFIVDDQIRSVSLSA